MRKSTGLCTEDGCGAPARTKGRCLRCYGRTWARERRAGDPALRRKQSASNTAWRKRVGYKPKNVLARYLKYAYGLTPEMYRTMVLRQHNRCAICFKQGHRERTKRLSVDHEHKTGFIRGLLCDRCNRAIGSFNDEVKLLLAAARYLKRHKAKVKCKK